MASFFSLPDLFADVTKKIQLLRSQTEQKGNATEFCLLPASYSFLA
jgi:hypothetical protein